MISEIKQSHRKTPMKRILYLAALLALTPLTSQAQLFANGIPTNATVDATNTQWVCPFEFSSIWFVNDSLTNIYMTPSGTNLQYIVCTNYLLTVTQNFRDPIGGTNISSTSVTGKTSSCVTNSIGALKAGTGTRLNANGGYIIFNSTGKPGVRAFQFISQGGNGNNLCINIGATTPTIVTTP